MKNKDNDLVNILECIEDEDGGQKETAQIHNRLGMNV